MNTYELSQLSFEGKGESTVEQKFLTPLLELLGYETHKDYEVLRHGDDGTRFKLTYPPVESGAVRVKYYTLIIFQQFVRKCFG